MIGEVEGVIDERVDVGRLALAAAAARMRQHALDDAVGAPTVLGDFLQIAGQHPDDLVDLRTRIIGERCYGWCCGLFQLAKQFDRQVGEIINEIERVLDLVGNPGGQLAQGRHLLGMQ